MFNIKKAITKKIPVYKFFSHRSYSQEGEDMVLRGFYEGRKEYKGFYIDIGAHHPYRFSNTMYFYKKGWKGINIEPNPPALKLFNFFRKKDINLNIGISETRQSLPFYCFNEPALNGFSESVSLTRQRDTPYKIIKTLDIPTLPLAEVLDQNLPINKKIDFLNIDVEGMDLTVLQSNNWDKYCPDHILIEDAIDLNEPNSSEVYKFLTPLNYELVAKTGRTLIFRNKNN